MKQDKKKLLQIISKAAYDYEKHLNNKYFLIVFQEGRKIEYVQIGFRDMYFLHLTGVKTKLSAQRFYHACLHGKLAEKMWSLTVMEKYNKNLWFCHIYTSCCIIRVGLVIL